MQDAEFRMQTARGVGRVLVFRPAVIALVIASWVALSAQSKQIPVFEPDPLFFEALPNKWVTGQVGGVAVDSK